MKYIIAYKYTYMDKLQLATFNTGKQLAVFIIKNQPWLESCQVIKQIRKTKDQ